MTDKTFWLNCDCHSAHHAIRVSMLIDEPFYDLVFEMQVNPHQSFWRRLVEGIKFIFNFKNKNCSYDSFNLHPKDIDKFMELLVEFKNTHEKMIKLNEQKIVAESISEEREIYYL